MSFLYLLQEWRTPVLDAVFSTLTLLGEEAFFLFIALTVYWCIDKKNGYYLLTVSFIGLTVNQLLKLIFRIPRPWVLDPDFPIVEEAREAATGYSFPSGHTQNAVNTFGSIARFTGRRALRIVCLSLIPVVAFSRMYLGVHTPKDVLVSIGIGCILVLGMYPLMQRAGKSPSVMYAIIGTLIVGAIAFALFVECYPFPADLNAENWASGRKNAWTILGCSVAMLVVDTLDHYRLNFATAAPLPAQLCKLVLGAALTLALKSLLRAPLLALCGGHPAAHALRYFLIVLFAAAVWPITFPFWVRLFSRKRRLDKPDNL